jgi:hypothetical protein
VTNRPKPPDAVDYEFAVWASAFGVRLSGRPVLLLGPSKTGLWRRPFSHLAQEGKRVAEEAAGGQLLDRTAQVNSRHCGTDGLALVAFHRCIQAEGSWPW